MQHEQLALFPESAVAPAGRTAISVIRIVPLNVEASMATASQAEILPFDQDEVTL